jgi:hypothetical protein
MDIRIVSSLTPDDENRVAPALLETLRTLMASLPVAYAVRIQTASGRVWQQQNVAQPPDAQPAAS